MELSDKLVMTPAGVIKKKKKLSVKAVIETFIGLYIGMQVATTASGWYDIWREKKAFDNSMKVLALERTDSSGHTFRYRDRSLKPDEIGYKTITDAKKITSLDLLNISTSILHRYPTEKNDDCSEYASTLFEIYQTLAKDIGRPDLSKNIRIATGLVDYNEGEYKGSFGHNWVETYIDGQWRQYESMKLWVSGLDRRQNIEYSPIRTRFAVTKAGSRKINFVDIDLSLNPYKGPWPILQYLSRKVVGAQANLTYEMVNKAYKDNIGKLIKRF